MSSLRVTSLRGRTAGTAPTLPDGAVVTGVTTSTSGEFTSSAVIGYGVTINGTGIQLAAGIVTAFCTKVGSAVTINPSGIDAISGIGTFGSIISSGTVSASGAAGGLATEINAKASTGKAIAMAMVFG